jgi:hypothetical protein
MYKIVTSKLFNTTCIFRLSDEAYIPMDEANTDYQEYLKWLAEGNLPSPEDIVELSQASVEPSPVDGE